MPHVGNVHYYVTLCTVKYQEHNYGEAENAWKQAARRPTWKIHEEKFLQHTGQPRKHNDWPTWKIHEEKFLQHTGQESAHLIMEDVKQDQEQDVEQACVIVMTKSLCAKNRDVSQPCLPI